jgi:outer membrane biosynthesis protein TonB/pSer/pThr/pTyr-binding forkhead associated (FHA) protein
MSLELRFQVPGQSFQVVSMNESRMLIGTLLSNHVVVRAPDVDPIHAMIEEVDGKWLITDLGSEFGVRINGNSIDVESELNAGDQIQIGTVTVSLAAKANDEDLIPPPVPSPNRRAEAVEVQKTFPSESKSSQVSQRTAKPESRKSGISSSLSKDSLSRDKINQATQKIDRERRVERKDQLFSPRKARPSGSVLECVAYWDDTVLDVELFHPRFKGYERVTIGNPTSTHFISAGEQDIVEHMLAVVREDGYKIRLLPGMEARFRKGGKVETHQGPGTHRLGRRDIAHIRFGAVRYFLLFCRPPVVELPTSRLRDPFLVTLSTFAFLVYMAILVPISLSAKPDQVLELNDDQIAIINIPLKEQVKKKTFKPKVEIKQVKKKPETPPVPKPEPQKPKLVEKIKTKPKKPPKKVVKKSQIKKDALKTLTKNKTQTAKSKPKKSRSSLNKLAKVKTGMASINAKKPDFKLSGAKTKAKRQGAAGGRKGGGNSKRGGARKGRQKDNVYGVSGVKNNRGGGRNLAKLGLGVGKILPKSAPGAIRTNFNSSVGGRGGGSGSASKNYGLGGGSGKRRTVGLGAGSGADKFGAGGSGGYLSGKGGRGGLGGNSIKRGAGRSLGDIELPSEDATVGGGLSQGEVLRVIRANLTQIRHCYEQLLQRSPKAQGKITTSFVIGLNGRVRTASIKASSIRDSTMKGCVTSRIKRWKFDKPRGGSPVNVTYPFVFNPV